MGNVSTQDIIQEIVRRKSWQQAQMIKEGDFNEATLSRIMGRLQCPQVNTYKKMMKILGTPIKPLYSPRLENASPAIITLYDGILYELARAHYHPPSLVNAKTWLEELHQTGNFNKGINKQYYAACQLRIDELENKNPNNIAKRALEALQITYPTFCPNTYSGAILIAGEPQLIHIYACALAVVHPSRAIEILQHTVEGIELTPQDERTKEKHLAPILLDLVKLLIAERRYEEAVTACNKGNDISLRRNRGKYNPDFTFHKAKVLKDHALLLPVYCGYIALGRRACAENVKQYAKEAGYTFPNYGLEAIPYQVPPFTLERGVYVNCEKPGDYIGFFRTQATLTQAELCNGICEKSTLNKIETGKLNGTVYQLEALMQRLGRHMEYYFDNYLTPDVFADREMEEEIKTRLATRCYNGAEELINILMQKNTHQKGLGKQIILLRKTALLYNRNQRNATYFSMLMDAWNITRKGVDIDAAHKHRLTIIEISLLSQVATYFCANGEAERGLRLFENLRRNLLFYYEDELERMRVYPMILYNLSNNLGRNKKHAKEMEIILEAENLCLKHGNLYYAYSIAGNKTTALYDTGKAEECIPYIAIAYYVADLLGYQQSKSAAKKYAVDNNLKITFV
ncbi:MAG: hypothetical protein FWC16_08640 [Defluviitaleaceae bacterium]|nr:hypothetical protein [Defluviitaleaceae bacterium]MCL2274978.1 hypothetical protein [Defluviitaleaceae bacterium]